MDSVYVQSFVICGLDPRRLNVPPFLCLVTLRHRPGYGVNRSLRVLASFAVAYAKCPYQSERRKVTRISRSSRSLKEVNSDLLRLIKITYKQKRGTEATETRRARRAFAGAKL